MSEATMRSNLVKALEKLDAVPIEMRMRAGTPDVNYIGGWIECKYLKFWPKNADTSPVIFGHELTKEQGLWGRRRCLRGGSSWVVAQVSRDWFWFSTIVARENFNKMTRPDMHSLCAFHQKNLKSEELVEWLINNSRG